jgi:solute carrier family 25 protein 16
MPSALLDNALHTPAITKDKPREMEGIRKKSPPGFSTSDDAVAPKIQKPHKQSIDYIWRTGVAGGLAGCAVFLSYL